MKIEEGKRYIRNDGEITRPARIEGCGNVRFVCDSPEGDFIAYYESGKCCIDWIEADLVSEYVEPTTKPTYHFTIGQTYTSANGSKWECIFVRDGKAWLVGVYDGVAEGSAYAFDIDGTASWACNADEYRIVFEPVRETVTVRGNVYTGTNGSKYLASGHGERGDNINITFDLINGTPDWSTAKVTPCD